MLILAVIAAKAELGGALGTERRKLGSLLIHAELIHRCLHLCSSGSFTNVKGSPVLDEISLIRRSWVVVDARRSNVIQKCSTSHCLASEGEGHALVRVV